MPLTDIISAHIRTFGDEGEQALFVPQDWRIEVSNGDTSLSYPDWLESQIEREADSAADDVKRLIEMAPEAFGDGVDRKENAQKVLSILTGLRMLDDDAATLAQGIIEKRGEPPLFGERFVVLPHSLAFDVSRLAQLVLGAPDRLSDRNEVEALCDELSHTISLRPARDDSPAP